MDWPGNLDMMWDAPSDASWYRELATFSRVILHDRRGIGLSSRNVASPNLETRVSDTLTVLDAVGSERPVLSGTFEVGAPNALLAATQPDRAAAMVWVDPHPRYSWAPDYPWGRPQRDRDAELRDVERWGTMAYGDAFVEDLIARGGEASTVSAAWMARASRNACTPDVARVLAEIWTRPMFARSPRSEGADPDRRGGRRPDRCAEGVLRRIADPRGGVTLPAGEHPLGRERAEDGRGDPPVRRGGASPHRARDCAIDRAVHRHRRFDGAAVVARRSRLEGVAGTPSRGRPSGAGSLARISENDTAGDGFYATFDGPARAIRCGLEISDRVRDLGIEIRAGIHTGGCELVYGEHAGITVSIGARVASLAGPSQVVVSQTVKDLVAGSGFTFEDAGEHDLKGVPGPWRLYRVTV